MCDGWVAQKGEAEDVQGPKVDEGVASFRQ